MGASIGMPELEADVGTGAQTVALLFGFGLGRPTSRTHRVERISASIPDGLAPSPQSSRRCSVIQITHPTTAGKVSVDT
jgi:hypothetical protein